MKGKYEAPEYEKKAFTCPNCSAFSKHDWKLTGVDEEEGIFSSPYFQGVNPLYLCKCENCGYISFWYKEELIWPLNSSVEAPLEEMPEDIKELYNEARNIVELSPKGSCAILRLALQKLCNRLAKLPEASNLNGAIKKLVEIGLPKDIQKAMDIVRIVGNEAVHPGEINLDDNKELAITMFKLMNIVIERMIIQPKEINDLYSSMPETKTQRIDNRDKDSKKS